jgi:DNA-binding transcriptional LysR family regulator
MLQAALDGLGFAYIPLELAQSYLASGQLIAVLEEWWPHCPGYHLYYTSRRQMAPALAEVIAALRWHR